MTHHLTIPGSFTSLVLRRRWLVLSMLGVATVALGVVGLRAPLRVSLLEGLMDDRSEYNAYLERAEVFGGTSDDVISVAVCEGDRLFTPETLNATRAAARDLEALPEIGRVVSFVDVPRIAPPTNDQPTGESLPRTLLDVLVGGKPLLKPHWPVDPEEQASLDVAEVKRAILADPAASRMLSRDGRSHVMLLQLAEASDARNQLGGGVRQKVEGLLESHGLGGEGIHCAGTLVVQDWMYNEAIRSLVLLLPLTAAVALLLVWLFFHRLSYILVTAVISGGAVLWTLGASALVFGHVTLFVVAAMGLILIIATSDTIHLLSAYVTELREGLAPDEAVRKSFREVGGACILTSVTTCLGFLSLLLVPAAAIRHMALACGVGVAAALLLALTIVPIALTILPPPRIDRRRGSAANAAVSSLLAVLLRICTKRPRATVIVHLVLALVCVRGVLGITLDADFSKRFTSSHPLRRSVEFFNNEMGGATTVEFTIRSRDGDLLTPKVLAGIDAMEREIGALPEVGDVVSLTSVFRLADNSGMLSRSDGGVPSTASEARAVVDLARLVAPEPIDGLLSRDDRMTRVIVRMRPSRVREVAECAERIRLIGERHLPDGATIESSGLFVAIGNAANQILRGQLQGFAICFLSVMTVVMIGVRSLRLSVLAILPNLFPLLLLGGLLALTSDVVDLDIMGVAIVSFGLAIDDTIHFLHRYDIEAATASTRVEAIERTFQYTGGAIVRTTIILGAGLAPLALSHYTPVRSMGTYLIFVLAAAVPGDLLLLPALILLFGDGKPRSGAQSPSAPETS